MAADIEKAAGLSNEGPSASTANQTGQSAQKGQTGAPSPATAPAKGNLQTLEEELKQLEIESKKLELEFNKANLIDMKEKLAERELKRENIRQEAYTKGATLKSIKDGEIKQQAHCNHKKGGNGAQGVVGGQGDDSQYAVLKHKFAHGDVWIRCLRCGKSWRPPVKSQHKTKDSFDAAMEVYRTALNFQTRNVTSGGVVFNFSDGGEYYREQTKDISLR